MFSMKTTLIWFLVTISIAFLITHTKAQTCTEPEHFCHCGKAFVDYINCSVNDILTPLTTCNNAGGNICPIDGKCYALKLQRTYAAAQALCADLGGSLISGPVTDPDIVDRCLEQLENNVGYWIIGGPSGSSCPYIKRNSDSSTTLYTSSCTDQRRVFCEIAI